jgi:hypothetical protein
MAALEKNAILQGLQYIEELVFENGAVYKGIPGVINYFRLPS